MGTVRLAVLGLIATAVALGHPTPGRVALAGPAVTDCQPMDWFPSDFGLKDHAVFRHEDHYYLASILFQSGHIEDRFAYARSTDLCDWEELPPILTERTAGAWDEFRIWAPHAFEEAGVHYLYYTGVTYDITQTIMLATTSDPADPDSWQPQPVIFQPSHPGAVWQAGAWADCRDPMVLKVEDVYHLYYSGTDQAGGIVGLATSNTPEGPWADRGAVLTLPETIPESATVAEHDGLYYLFYTVPFDGGYYRVGPSPAGPWSPATPFRPGWAHEVWEGEDGYPYTSFLFTYAATISRLTWDDFFSPPRPFIGASVHHLLLPFVGR